VEALPSWRTDNVSRGQGQPATLLIDTCLFDSIGKEIIALVLDPLPWQFSALQLIACRKCGIGDGKHIPSQAASEWMER